MATTTDTICLPLKEVRGLVSLLYHSGDFLPHKSLYLHRLASGESLVFWSVTYGTPWRGIEKMKFL